MIEMSASYRSNGARESEEAADIRRLHRRDVSLYQADFQVAAAGAVLTDGQAGLETLVP